MKNLETKGKNIFHHQFLVKKLRSYNQKELKIANEFFLRHNLFIIFKVLIGQFNCCQRISARFVLFAKCEAPRAIQFNRHPDPFAQPLEDNLYS